MALSTMKDEAPFVVEWVAHHLAVGFTDIVVYTNDCTDGTDTMLKRMQALKIGVFHRDNVIPEGIKPQPSMLKHASEDPLVRASDWLLILDADEFLAINHPSGTMDGLVGDLNAMDAHAMVLTWRIFGSSGIRDWSRQPVTDQFTRAAPEFWHMGWGTKTLFRYDPKYLRPGIHRPIIKSQFKDTDYPGSVLWVNGSGRPMEEWFKLRGWRSIRRTVGYDWGQVNHYAIKSMDAYSLRKFRGNVNQKKDKYNADYWALQDRNEVEDLRIARHRERRNQIMDWLLQDPRIRELHEAAHDRAEARLAEYRRSEDYQALVEGLVAASQVPISDVVAKPPKPRDREAIKAMQSKLDQKRQAKPKEDRRTPPPPDWGSPVTPPYVSGPVDLSADLSLAHGENQGLKIPLDPRILTAATMEVVRGGKFDRRHARNIPALLGECRRLLDLDAGFGFIALRARLACPDLEITIHDERPALQAFSRRVATLNFPEATGISWSQATLNPDGLWSGLDKLVQSVRPDILRLSDPRLPAEAFPVERLAGLRRVLVPFPDPAEAGGYRARLASAFQAAGLTEDPAGEAAGSLLFRRV